MSSKESLEPTLPTLYELGLDLLQTTPCQRRWACLRPMLGLIAYIVVASLEWWWLTPAIVFLIFVAIVTVTHDVVHGSLGLSPRQTEWALFVFGAMLLESGHAYRITHLQHHRKFPEKEDPEGDPARLTFWRAVLHGIIFLPRLWWWAYRQETCRDQRRWLLIEASWAISILILGIVLWPWTSIVGVYAILAIVGSWVYPLLTVYLPHHDYGDTPLTQTSSLRGTFIPALFLELTYHLEHHLYPSVPSHQLSKLSERLEPTFQDANVQMRRVF